LIGQFLSSFNFFFALSFVGPLRLRILLLLLFFFLHFKFLFLNLLQLVPEVKFSSLLLQFGKLVFIFGNLLQCRLHAVTKNKQNAKNRVDKVFEKYVRVLQFASQVIHKDIELVDLKSDSESNFRIVVT